ncbi:hypothetical protein QPK87_28580 [Kamptonema cortianum]|nr:hypothetical protein [Kamptonema cortianum]
MRLLLRSDPVPELPRPRHVPSAGSVKGTRRALAVSGTAQARSERLDTTAERATVARLRAQSGTEAQQAAFSATGNSCQPHKAHETGQFSRRPEA